jgi:cellulose biosynthesis protein BcsQ
LQEALRAADLVIAVLLADAASFASLPALVAQLEAQRRAGARFAAHLLLNGVDGVALSRDVRTLMEAQAEISVLPLVIHRDEAVREALGAQRPVVEHAPSGQAAADLRQLAQWISDELDHDEEADRDRAPLRLADVAPAVRVSS